MSAHFDIAPHPPLHMAFVASWSIEPDASRTIRMSGGSFDEGLSKAPHSTPPPDPVMPAEPLLVPPKPPTFGRPPDAAPPPTPDAPCPGENPHAPTTRAAHT